MLLETRKAINITSRSNHSQNYKKKNTCSPKPKPSNHRPKRAKLHLNPHYNFSTRKLVDTVEDKVTLEANLKSCGSYDMPSGTGWTVVGHPMGGMGGLKDPGPVVTGTSGKSMVFTRGSGSRSRASGQDRAWLTEDEIRALISTKVVNVIWEQILELFRYIKTTKIQYFDDQYTALSKAIVVVANMILTTPGLL
ncbi:unnamed protein product [Lactuca saligna]|uniref:Uncharacterized protein n=1 Tax=Lactuca saligna TaxID=75948 RepID=A0AA35YWR1_LACSI|nr:unnamed protein product [Lactuca saligna]